MNVIDRILRRPGPYDMVCVELVELVTDYFEGALPAGDRRRFEAHLKACDGCETYVDQLRATIAVAGELRPEHLSPEAERALLDAFRDWKSSGRG
jgi:anti-sigma factor RsiW